MVDDALDEEPEAAEDELPEAAEDELPEEEELEDDEPEEDEDLDDEDFDEDDLEEELVDDELEESSSTSSLVLQPMATIEITISSASEAITRADIGERPRRFALLTDFFGIVKVHPINILK